jgi:cobalamin biosynthesis Mg chelatase CobN
MARSLAGSRAVGLTCALVVAVAGFTGAARAANTTTTSPSTTASTKTETRTETRTETSKTTATETRSVTKTRTLTKTPTATTSAGNTIVANQTTNVHGSNQGNGVPAWAWVLIGLGVLAVVLLAVLIANARRRQSPPAATGQSGSFDEPSDRPRRL